MHEYLFSKIILKDGQRTKVLGGITEPELTTVYGQKIIRGITKADLTTVNGQNNYRGCQKPGRGTKRLPAEGRLSPKSPNVMPLESTMF